MTEVPTLRAVTVSVTVDGIDPAYHRHTAPYTVMVIEVSGNDAGAV